MDQFATPFFVEQSILTQETLELMTSPNFHVKYFFPLLLLQECVVSCCCDIQLGREYPIFFSEGVKTMKMVWIIPLVDETC